MVDPFGAFVWHELMTTDPAAAEDFYAHVLGVQARDAGLPERSYSILCASGCEFAGIMAIPEEARETCSGPAWTGYLGVRSVEQTAAQLQDAGGTVHRAPADIPDVGRFAIVADPHGAMFALFEGAGSGEPTAPAPQGTPGHVGWNELRAGDLESDFRFYERLFGWRKKEAVHLGEMGTYQTFGTDGPAFGGMMTKPPFMQAPPHWHFYFNVASVNDAMRRVAGKGGKILQEPTQVPGESWIVQCRDPQGGHFALVGPTK